MREILTFYTKCQKEYKQGNGLGEVRRPNLPKPMTVDPTLNTNAQHPLVAGAHL